VLDHVATRWWIFCAWSTDRVTSAPGYSSNPASAGFALTMQLDGPRIEPTGVPPRRWWCCCTATAPTATTSSRWHRPRAARTVATGAGEGLRRRIGHPHRPPRHHQRRHRGDGGWHGVPLRRRPLPGEAPVASPGKRLFRADASRRVPQRLASAGRSCIRTLVRGALAPPRLYPTFGFPLKCVSLAQAF
jgi:hypothetical protein